jgi:hypothetical protein
VWEGTNSRLDIYRIQYKTNYLLYMGGIGEGKKWMIIIWIWVRTIVDLSIPSPVAGLGIRILHSCHSATGS